jgi:hypothetical protein
MAEPLLPQCESPLARLQVERTGLTQLYSPAKVDDIVADVVFVHGLGGLPKTHGGTG